MKIISGGRFVHALAPHVIAFAILGGILTAGLRPFHAPLNGVSWLGDVPGLRFGAKGVVVSKQPFFAARPSRGHTIEIWLESADLRDDNTFFSFFRDRNRTRFALRQSETDLEIERYIRAAGEERRERLLVPNAFGQSRPVIATIVAGSSGTDVYLDCRLARSAPNFVFDPDEFAGQLVIGNSPLQADPWKGRLLGAAIYDRALNTPELGRHCEGWTKRGTPDWDGQGHAAALYLFDENHGDTIHNRVAGAPELGIPRRFVTPGQIFLEPFWDEFNWSWGFWKNVLINIGGFIPFGFVFRAYLTSMSEKRRIDILVISLGLLVSLTIEVFQSLLPTRQSGTTDLITNTLGTAVGVGLNRWCPAVLSDPLRRAAPFRTGSPR